MSCAKGWRQKVGMDDSLGILTGDSWKCLVSKENVIRDFCSIDSGVVCIVSKEDMVLACAT